MSERSNEERLIDACKAIGSTRALMVADLETWHLRYSIDELGNHFIIGQARHAHSPVFGFDVTYPPDVAPLYRGQVDADVGRMADMVERALWKIPEAGERINA